MKALALLATLIAAAPLFAQQLTPEEAYQKLEQRMREKEAAATQASPAEQLTALQSENARLKAIIADLQLQIDALKQGGAVAAAPTTQPAVGYVPTGSYTGSTATGTGYTGATGTRTTPQPSGQTSPNGEQQTGQTATGIPQYTGPRGGTYHYSKSGNKVYDKKK